jgi:hypothetical protein
MSAVLYRPQLELNIESVFCVFPEVVRYTHIEQVLKEKKPFILHCMSSDLKVMQGRSPA